MKFIKNLIVAFVLLVAILGLSVCASATEYSITRSESQDEIVISGKANGKELFSVQILSDGVTPDNIQSDNTKGAYSIFSKTLESNSDGAFSFNVKIPASGAYTAYIRAVSDTNPLAEKFIFTLEAEKADAVQGVITKLNSGENIDIVNYAKDFFYDDADLMNYMEKFLNSNEQISYFSSKMKNKAISNYDDLLLCTKKALILTAAKNSDGPGNLKDIMETYSSILNISSFTDNMSVYTSIKGEYADVESLKSAYNNKVGNVNVQKPSSNEPTNSKGTYSPSSVGTVQVGSSANQTATPINIKFEDLSSVEWAYKDISELYDKGIINGVSEHLFRPNTNVKREEFVKLIVCAMGLQNESAQGAGFADVEPGAWYESYVNIARQFSISSGMGDNKFGVGIGISRQDMAVMIYNSMKQRGYVPSGQENTFADKSSCADYANEAIAELCAKGIVGGVGNNIFNPTGEATRAEAAVIINRALAYLD